MKRAYLAGPMRKIKDFNFPAFIEGARKLRDAGYEVFCPAEYEKDLGFDPRGYDGDLEKFAKDTGFSLRAAMATDLSWICKNADIVVVLPGWESSSGARAEVHTAWALGIPVVSLGGVLRQDNSHGRWD